MNKKDVILKNALEIFNENGYVGTSINDVAKKSGIAKSTIFHYFENLRKNKIHNILQLLYQKLQYINYFSSYRFHLFLTFLILSNFSQLFSLL